MKKQYKFQMENGSIYDGNYEIIIRDYIAEIDDITPAIKLVIEAHGGLLVEEKVEHVSQLVESQKLKKRKVKPVKWQKKEAAREVTELLEKVKEMNEGVK